ncbi:MAG: choice-of-anchor Q domain-containing protein [Bacteroidota bacterium]
MRKKITLGNIALVLMILLLTISVSGQVVTSSTDDGSPGTLRSQIIAAAPGATITVDAGVSNITLTLGQITINKSLTLTGNGVANTTINGNAAGRIFDVTTGNFTLNAITLTNGLADNGGAIQVVGANLILNTTAISNSIANGASGSGGAVIIGTGATLIATNSTFTGNRSNRAGGAIEAVAGTTITLTNTTLTANNTGVAPATAAPGNGGGFHMTGNGTVMITGGLVNNNIAAAEGGGLWNGTGTMTVDGTTIDGNTASGVAADNGGGGIYVNNGGTLIVQNNAIISNNIANGTAGSGGGILSDVGAIVMVSNSTITGNRSNRAGGGIEAVASTSTTLNNVTLTNNNTGVAPAVAAPGNGGGFHITGSGNATINGGTASGNVAGNQGGGLWNGSGTMTVTGTTVSMNNVTGNAATSGGGGLYNQVGTLTVSNATISNNMASGTVGIGGGILNNGAAVNLNTTTLNNNTANLNGGGIFTNNGTTTIQSNSMLTNNTALGATAPTSGGGGIYISSTATVSVTGGALTSNKAITGGGSGGGVFNFSGTFNANGTAITQNISNRAGGGIEAAAGSTTNLTSVSLNNNVTGVIASGATAASPGNGGGLHITGAGNATILGGTANNNMAGLEGGGLWNGAGLMTVTNTTVNGNTAFGAAADDGGAGLFNNAGTLTLNNATVTNNNATGALGSGGGILSLVGTVTITNSTLDNNSANRAGGAIEVVNGTLIMTNSNMTNNDVDGTAGTPNPGNGGALHITGITTTTITGGTVSGNDARREGGGLWNQTGSTMTVNNVTINNNVARGNGATFGGGGIFVNGGNVIVNTSSITNNTSTGAAGNGGGVHVKTGSATIMTATISGNSSAANGGGVFSNAGLTINASTIANNTATANGGGISNTSASLPVLKNTIVASNMATTDADVSSTTGAFVSNGFNLIGKASATSFVAASGDIVGSNAMPVNAFLNALANNGGLTLTHSLQANSPAYNGGDNADSFTDQIGNALFGGRRDIGAYESQVAGLSFTNLQGATCGATINALTVTINANVATAAQGYRFRITKVDSMTNVAIAAATVVDRPVNNISLTNVAGITYNSRYQIEVAIQVNNVWQAYGATCYVNTPNPVSTIGAQCGTTLSTLNQSINATAVPKVTGYRFRVTQLDGSLQPVGTPQVTTQSLNKFNMTQLSGILYATTYRVEVALGNTNGVYLDYNAPCNITTPNHPVTQLVASQCASYMVPNKTTFVYADIVSGATQYKFRLFNGGYDATYTNTSNRFTLNNFAGIVSGTYSVQVAVKLPNELDFGPYGSTCSIVYSVAAKASYTELTTAKANTLFEVVAYPNPYTESFKLNFETNSEETIHVLVYDMLGKLVEDRNVTASDMETLEIGNNYNSGVFNIIVSQGENAKTMRVIKR